jgi:subtilisin family serine protease
MGIKVGFRILSIAIILLLSGELTLSTAYFDASGSSLINSTQTLNLKATNPQNTTFVTPKIKINQDPVTIDPGVQAEINTGQKVDVWLHLRQSADLSSIPATFSKNQRGKYVFDALTQTANASQAHLRSYLRLNGIKFEAHWIVDSILAYDVSSNDLTVIATFPEILGIFGRYSAQLDTGQIEQSADINRTLADLTTAWSGTDWGLEFTNASEVWNTLGDAGAGIVVANIDTGVEATHPVLVNQYRGTLTGSNNYNWYAPTSQAQAACTNAATTPCDWHGHGTHTMGTMVGDDGVPGSSGHRTGMAPEAEWIACMGCDLTSSNGCSDNALIGCAEWVLAPTDLNGQNADPTKAPDIVNNSWGGGQGSDWFKSYVEAWVAAGIFPAFSEGNSGPSCSTANDPGDYPESFATGAIDSTGEIASFSSRGPGSFSNNLKPDLVAPGVSIYSSWNNDGYTALSGTSMASPHTAGAVALLWSAIPALKGNVSSTINLLYTSANPDVPADNACGAPGSASMPNYTYGYGYLDAMALVLNGCDCSPVLSTTEVSDPFWVTKPMTFNVNLTNPSTGLSYLQARLNLTIQNATLSNITSLEYKSGSDWVTILLTQSGANVTGYIGSPGGILLSPGATQSITLRANWALAGIYVVEIDLVNSNYSAPVLANTVISVQVFNSPSISLNGLNMPFISDVSYPFSVALTNPAAPTGTSITQANLLFTFLNTNLADISALKYQSGEDWLDLSLVQSGANVVGNYPLSGGFTISSGNSTSFAFLLSFAGYGIHSLEIDLINADQAYLLLSTSTVVIPVGNYQVFAPLVRQRN